MLNSLIALKTLRYPADHPLLVKAQRDFAGLFVDDPQDFRIQPCLSPVWDTAINLIALIESGVPAEDPRVVRAIAWLASKEVRVRGDWCVRNPGVEPSGWAFEFNNIHYPDTDDTMMVLIALRFASESGKSDGSFAAEDFARALRWLLSFQCRDGGWAAFDKDLMQRWLEDVPFADHNAILDPTCSDLTGRVLELLGYLGCPRETPCVQDALAFLRDTQEDDGSWYGRWGVNYVYGTWQVLRGLRSIGEDMRQPWILRARATGSRVVRMTTVAGAKRARATTIRSSRAKVRAHRRKPRGRSWASSPRATRRSRGTRAPHHSARTRLSARHASRGRLLARAADHRHRFSARFLPALRHVSQQLAPARPGHLAQLPAGIPPRPVPEFAFTIFTSRRLVRTGSFIGKRVALNKHA
jgi:squalene cyclase